MSGVEAAQGRRAPLRRAPAGRPLRVKMISPAKTAAGQPLLALDQVLAVPAARPRHPGRLPRPGRRDRPAGRARRDPATSTTSRTSSSSRRTSPRRGRAYRYADHYRARGAYVCLGGLHPTSLPEEAAQHADSVFCGPGEDTWPAFLARLPRRPAQAALPLDRAHAGRPAAGAPRPHQARALPRAQLAGGQPRLPAPLRLLLQGGVLPRRPVVLRAGGRRCPGRDRPPPGRHLYFLDDNLFGSPPFAEALFDGLKGMGRVWQAAGTVEARAPARPAREGRGERAAQPLHRLRDAERGQPAWAPARRRTWPARGLAAEPGARTTTPPSAACTTSASWSTAAFVFGMDHDDPSVFARTVEWAVSRGIETATFHILTPYPGTRLERAAGGRGPHHEPRLGPLRHAPRRVRAGRHDGRRARGRLPGAPTASSTAGAASRARPSRTATLREHVRHLAYTSGWKKLEPMWDRAIRSGQVHRFLPLLETILDRFGSGGGAMPGRLGASAQRPAGLPQGKPAGRSAADLRRTAGPSANLPCPAS